MTEAGVVLGGAAGFGKRALQGTGRV
jgi:hypothetical protein